MARSSRFHRSATQTIIPPRSGMAWRARLLRPLAAVIALMMMFAVFASPARAQEDIRAAVLVPQGDWTVGDVIALSLQVRHPAGWRVIIPALEGQWGDFEIRSQGVPQIRDNNDGTETTVQPLEVALYAPGDHATPPLEITVVDPNGTVSQFLVPSSTVTLRSVLSGDDTTLRDIKPQWTLEVPNLLPVILGSVAVFGVLAVLAIRGVRARLANREVVDTRTPYQRAYDDLVVLESSSALSEATYKDHYAKVASTLRQLIEDIYSFPATECTTAEMRRALRGLSISEEQAQYALFILQECDVAKFAGVSPESDEARTIAARARQWIIMIDPSLSVARNVRPGRVA
jgi:hypothetical protein